MASHRLDDARARLAQRALVRDAELHRARLRLVRQVRRDRLHDDGVANLSGRAHRSIRVGDESFARAGDPVAGKQAAGVDFVERAVGLAQHRARARLIDAGPEPHGVRGDRGGATTEPAVLDQRAKRPITRVGRREDRHAALLQHAEAVVFRRSPFRIESRSHPQHDQRLVRLARDVDHVPGNVRGALARARQPERDDEQVIAVVADEEIEQLRQMLRALSPDVERVAEVADDEEQIALRQPLRGFRREWRQREPVDPALVGEHDAEAAGGAEDRDAFAARLGAAGEHRRDLEEVVGVGDADHPGLREGGVVDGVGTRHRPGVRHDLTGAGLRAADLADEDRLAGVGRFARHVEERAAAAGLQAFQQAGDHADVGIADEVPDVVDGVDDRFVAARHGETEADAAIARRRQDRRERHGPALRHERDVAGPHRKTGEGMDHRRRARVHDPETVRPAHNHAVRVRDRSDLRLRRATRVARLAEACADDEGGRDAFPPARVEHLEDSALRHDEHGEIRRLRKSVDRRMARVIVDRRLAWIDQIEAPSEASLRKIDEQPARVRVRLRCADDRDRSRRQQRTKIPVGHAPLLSRGKSRDAVSSICAS